MKTSWQRPFTAKRYIHPPFADKIITVWPDMKVIISTVGEQNWGMTSSAFRILVGDGQESPDFKQVKYFTRPDGVPIHKLAHDFGAFSVEMENFCNLEKNPTAYTAFTVKNKTDSSKTERLYLLPRTGKEEYLTGMEIDGYASYDSGVRNWGFIPSDWMLNGNILTDGVYSICVQGDVKLSWQGTEKGLCLHQRKCAVLTVDLQPNETKTVYVSFAKGKATAFDYDTEKEKTNAFWLKELENLHTVPGGEQNRELVNNLVLQCLQMFSVMEGTDLIIPRQGGLQRRVWQAEAVEFLTALDRFGDYFSYTKTAYETFFHKWQIRNGENKGAITNMNGEPWGSITGASCLGLGKHLIYRKDENVFNRFKEEAYLAFKFMEAQRAKTKDGSYVGVGLFPPMRASDWSQVGQNWCITDGTNLLGYKSLADAFEYFKDDRATEINNAYQDYMQCMRKVLVDQIAKYTDGDELFIQSTLGAPVTDPPATAYFVEVPTLFRAGVVEKDSDTARKIEAWFHNRNLMKNGLTGLMTCGRASHGCDPWAGHTWYLSFGDMGWFYTYLAQGEKDKAKKVMNGLLTYGMTKEYYLAERYADNDPYFVPWLPNASANGRLMHMLEAF